MNGKTSAAYLPYIVMKHEPHTKTLLPNGVYTKLRLKFVPGSGPRIFSPTILHAAEKASAASSWPFHSTVGTSSLHASGGGSGASEASSPMNGFSMGGFMAAAVSW